jgi:hypothetical protein
LKNIFCLEPDSAAPASKSAGPPSGGDSKPPGKEKGEGDAAAPPPASKIFPQFISFTE